MTVLTSLDGDELRAVGISRAPEEQVLDLAALGMRCGVRGVVCSPREISSLRSRLGDSFDHRHARRAAHGIVGGRPKRVSTPADAVRAGANYLVIGRPITGAKSPRDAALRIADEITEGLAKA